MEDNQQNPPFSSKSCSKCLHQGVCSALKASASLKEQWEQEYEYVKLPPTFFDLAKYCEEYVTTYDIIQQAKEAGMIKNED